MMYLGFSVMYLGFSVMYCPIESSLSMCSWRGLIRGSFECVMNKLLLSCTLLDGSVHILRLIRRQHGIFSCIYLIFISVNIWVGKVIASTYE